MNKYLDYYNNNPKGYWFKRKLFGWGWVPVRWQGWLVIFISLIFCFAGIYIGETDDAPGAAFIGILLMIAIIFFFGFWKGEKPRWQWGLPKRK
jgi:drug/metabolite transporter (DMT)-like permease